MFQARTATLYSAVHTICPIHSCIPCIHLSVHILDKPHDTDMHAETRRGAYLQSCVKTFLPSSENHTKFVPTMHYGGEAFQAAVPGTWQGCFYTTLYLFAERCFRGLRRLRRPRDTQEGERVGSQRGGIIWRSFLPIQQRSIYSLGRDANDASDDDK